MKIYQEVTFEEFFKAIPIFNTRYKADVMPTHEGKDSKFETLWRCQKTRNIFGKSVPGWGRVDREGNHVSVRDRKYYLAVQNID